VFSRDRGETVKANYFNEVCGNQFDEQIDNCVFQIYCSRHCAQEIASSSLQDPDAAEDSQMITPQMLQNTLREIEYRVYILRATRGSNVEI
jgi:hypothetical protein